MLEICGRKVVIVLENDTIGDAPWYPELSSTLHKYANHIKKTGASGDSPQLHHDSNGNKLTVFWGTCPEILPLVE